ncbi:hypothetical protein [Haloferula sargassicola]|uniref:hypothetical protein n=1 Tax=Haloferula sargassicola TaxID=490096 RepID=UPI0033655F38
MKWDTFSCESKLSRSAEQAESQCFSPNREFIEGQGDSPLPEILSTGAVPKVAKLSRNYRVLGHKTGTRHREMGHFSTPYAIQEGSETLDNRGIPRKRKQESKQTSKLRSKKY